MTFNIFEGARRLALLLSAGVAVITVLVAFNESAYNYADYSLSAPNAPFIKTNIICPSEGKRIYFDHKTSSGNAISVSICLQPMTFTNKNMDEAELIPYKMDTNGMTWGAGPYSHEVTAYETQVKKRFYMSATDEAIIIKEAKTKWRNKFTETMAYLAIGLAIFGTLVYATGWIVRGFLGIPRGMDKRPNL